MPMPRGLKAYLDYLSEWGEAFGWKLVSTVYSLCVNWGVQQTAASELLKLSPVFLWEKPTAATEENVLSLT